jgi:hypothetical protein
MGIAEIAKPAVMTVDSVLFADGRTTGPNTFGIDRFVQMRANLLHDLSTGLLALRGGREAEIPGYLQQFKAREKPFSLELMPTVAECPGHWNDALRRYGQPINHSTAMRCGQPWRATLHESVTWNRRELSRGEPIDENDHFVVVSCRFHGGAGLHGAGERGLFRNAESYRHDRLLTFRSWFTRGLWRPRGARAKGGV